MARHPRTRWIVALVGVLALSASACSSEGGNERTTAANVGGSSSEPGAIAAPAGQDFYIPPDPLPPGEPGDLIWAAPIEGPPGTDAWRVLYRSTTMKGTPVAVSGLLFAPEPGPTDRPVPILAVAHGTTGLADRTAPSKLVETEANSVEVGHLPGDLERRYVVVATDYEGLGTPGVHPYVVGMSEGRDVLDSIRAAQRFPGIGTSAKSKSVIWGHSQGGGATLVAAELAPTYAPDANVAGAVAGAPASELKLMGTALRTSPFFGYIFMAAAGFKAAYPELDLSTIFTPVGLAAVEQASDQSGTETIEAYRGHDPNQYLKADPGSTEPFASLLEENSPGVRSTTVPIFMYHGEADEQVPVIASELVLERYCANGTTAYRRTWAGADHVGVVSLALPEIERYLDARIAGTPAPTSCPAK